jgi:beta-N-acetylhexosaminidase
MHMTVEELIGNKLVFGVPGTTITPEIIRHFKETHCRGLILYRINFESPDQLRKLISDLESALGWRLLVCADHEGGRVIMFGGGVTVFPSSQAIGQTGNMHFARGQGEQEGRELRRLGIDVNFAPVLDVLTDAYSPNIGIRAYGKDPELVAKMGAARISAMQVEGVSACAKHFPGLGPATLDPHLKLPSIPFTWEDLEKSPMIPFYRAMRTAVHSIMTSHPLYPNLDATPKTPATFSRKIVHDYLRHKIGYKGVIFSDDLEMGAITELCPIGEAAVKTVAAGHDMVLVCHKQDAQRAAYDALLEAYRSRRLSEAELQDSHKRIELLRERRQERFAPPLATQARADKELRGAQALVHDIVSQSFTTLRQGPGLQMGASTAAIFPTLGAMAETVMIEPALQKPDAYLRDRLQSFGFHGTVSLYALDPSAAETQAASQAAAGADQTILFLYDAHIHGGEKTLLEAVKESAKRLVVVLLRDAYDEEFVAEGTLCVTNYGPRLCHIEGILEKLAAVPAASPTR